ncbi:MAG: tRNA lysidine(34) synthetase TilS [Gilvibacter sp.]
MQVLYLRMVKEVFDAINNEFSFVKGKQLGIAISGGLDSMVLSHILVACSLNLRLIHCNFKLRGIESDEDQAFLTSYANRMQLPLTCQEFDAKDYANQHKISTQMAARELRYTWFKSLIDNGVVDFIATAHHGNDSIETLLINLSRGAGLSGLSGIPAVNNHIIRPLLKFNRDQIQAYANIVNLQWREDSSNATDVYLRNAIRHKVLPELEKLSSDFIRKAMETQSHLRESQNLLQEYMVQLKKEIVRSTNETFIADIDRINSVASPKGFLFEWLNPFGFTAWNDIYDLLTAQSGKQIESPGFVLTKDRETLILSSKDHIKDVVIKINKTQVELEEPISLVLNSEIKSTQNTLNEIAVDADLLLYPLILRHWQNGDRFYPVGMEGSKKVSDYFTDLKISRPEKEKIWLLCSGQKIIWIIGYRADGRFEITPKTKNTLVITYNP